MQPAPNPLEYEPWNDIVVFHQSVKGNNLNLKPFIRSPFLELQDKAYMRKERQHDDGQQQHSDNEQPELHGLTPKPSS
ncbi:hypothetical protein D3C73_1545270 [compost metagenome]